MGFWSSQTSEPLRQHRWYMTFSGDAQLDTIQFALKKVDKPKAKIGEITHKYLNHFFYYPGRLEWEPINVTFASVTDPSAASYLWTTLWQSGYGVPTDTQNGPQRATLGKQKFNARIGSTISIQQVGPDGTQMERWDIVKPFFTSVQFGSLDYSNEDIVEITATIRYDYAKLSIAISNQDDSKQAVNPGFP